MIQGFGKRRQFDYNAWAATSLFEDGRWLLRAYWKRIAFFTLVGLGIAVAYNRWSPQEYVSRATVRFIPPQVAEAYASTKMAMQVEQRIFAVSQLATSRMTATQMIDSFNLYPQRRLVYPVADLVPLFQKRLKFSTVFSQGSGDKAIPSILVSFSDGDPNKAQQVVQKIVELIYEENRRYRSDESLGTTDFLDQEIKTVTAQIQDIEGQLAKLPTPGGEDKEYRNIIKTENLYSLERRVTEIEHDMSFTQTERNLRKNVVSEMEAQLARRIDQGLPRLPVPTAQTERLRAGVALAELNYENVRRRYQPNNPDVMATAQSLHEAEAQLKTQIQSDANAEYERDLQQIRGPLSRAQAELAGYEETLQSQRAEQNRLNTEIAKIRKQFAVGPEVEHARLQLMREYDAAKTQYAELAHRQQESHLSSDIERRGHGETAELVEPPTLPLRPESPTELFILSIGAVLGALAGYALGFLSFVSAPKVRTTSHIGLLGNVPVLVSLPGGTRLFNPSNASITSAYSSQAVTHSLLILATVAIVTATGCGIGAANRFSTELSAANAAMKSVDYRAAELRYRKAIQLNPRSGEAHEGLSRVYMATGNSIRAYEELIRAAELLSDRPEIAEHLADLTYQIYFADPGRPVTRLRELEIRAKDLLHKWPDRPTGFRLAGLVLVERHRNAEAIEVMENGLEHVEDGDLRTQLAAIYFQNGDQAKAEEHLRGAIRVNAKYVPAYDLLYLELMERTQIANARKVLEDKFLHNHNLETALQLAAHDDAVGQRALAENLLDACAREFSSDTEAYARIGDFWLNRAEFAQARRWYQEGLAKHSNVYGLYAGRLAEVLLAEKNPSDAQSLVDRELGTHPKDLFLRAYHAALSIDGTAAADRHKVQAELESVMAKMPNSPFVRLHLGRAYLLNGDAQHAGELFRSAVALDPNYAQGWLALADAEIRSGNLAQAEGPLKVLLARAPHYAPALLLQAQSNLAQNKPGEAEQSLSALLAADPQNPEVALALARAKLALGQLKEATQLLERVKELQPKDPRPALLEARVALQQGQTNAALETLRTAQQRMADSTEIASTLGSVALVANQPELALAQFATLVARDGANLQYRLGYASSLAMAGKAAESRVQFEYVQTRAGSDPQPWLLYGATMSAAGNTTAAAAAYAEALKRDSKNPYALNNLAFLLARKGEQLDHALTMAEEARHELPHSAVIGDTLTYIYVRKGMKRNAAATLEQLAEDLPANQQKRARSLLEQIRRGDMQGVLTEMERENAAN